MPACTGMSPGLMSLTTVKYGSVELAERPCHARLIGYRLYTHLCICMYPKPMHVHMYISVVYAAVAPTWQAGEDYCSHVADCGLPGCAVATFNTLVATIVVPSTNIYRLLRPSESISLTPVMVAAARDGLGLHQLGRGVTECSPLLGQRTRSTTSGNIPLG